MSATGYVGILQLKIPPVLDVTLASFLARQSETHLLLIHMLCALQEKWDFTTLVSCVTYSVSQQGMKSSIRLAVNILLPGMQ